MVRTKNFDRILTKSKKIDLFQLLIGKYTYPTWSTNRKYKLFITKYESIIYVSYKHKGNKQLLRCFPRHIKLTPKVLWFFGFIYGEGSKSKGSSAYRRFTITNSDSKAMCFCLDVLEETKLLFRNNISKHSVKLARSSKHDDIKLLKFWMKELKLSKDKFYMAPKPDETKKAENGVCHIFISDVLLRRVMDELSINIFKIIKKRIAGSGLPRF